MYKAVIPVTRTSGGGRKTIALETRDSTPDLILVVDDDPGMHVLLGHILRPIQCEVKYASNGYEALDIIAADHPSLVILDIQMPGMSGAEVFDRLAENAATADISVIIFSSSMNREQIIMYELETQIIKVIQKPSMRPSEIREIIRNFLQANKQ